eukprot:2932869-Pyramimonas_sp.AAC.1
MTTDYWQECQNRPPFAIENMRDAAQYDRDSVSSGCVGRQAQAPGALSRSERCERGPTTFSAPSGR